MNPAEASNARTTPATAEAATTLGGRDSHYGRRKRHRRERGPTPVKSYTGGRQDNVVSARPALTDSYESALAPMVKPALGLVFQPHDSKFTADTSLSPSNTCSQAPLDRATSVDHPLHSPPKAPSHTIAPLAPIGNVDTLQSSAIVTTPKLAPSLVPAYSLATNISLNLLGETVVLDLLPLDANPQRIIELLNVAACERGTWMVVSAFYRRSGNPHAAILVISAMMNGELLTN